MDLYLERQKELQRGDLNRVLQYQGHLSHPKGSQYLYCRGFSCLLQRAYLEHLILGQLFGMGR